MKTQHSKFSFALNSTPPKSQNNTLKIKMPKDVFNEPRSLLLCEKKPAFERSSISASAIRFMRLVAGVMAL